MAEPFALTPPAGALRSWASFSECGRYRYELGREWNSEKACVCWILLNPSTADALVDDQTTKKIRRFSESWGYGSFVLGNAYAWRATDPRALPRDRSMAVGPENDERIVGLASLSMMVVLGWGNNITPARAREVLELLRGYRTPSALRVSKFGTPAHPLYLRESLEPRPLDELLAEVNGGR